MRRKKSRITEKTHIQIVRCNIIKLMLNKNFIKIKRKNDSYLGGPANNQNQTKEKKIRFKKPTTTSRPKLVVFCCWISYTFYKYLLMRVHYEISELFTNAYLSRVPFAHIRIA